MYDKLINVDNFESIYLFTSGTKIDLKANTLVGSEIITLSIEDAKRLRNYLTEAINFATLNKEEE